MKTSLWIIIALVAGIVGFLMGYSVSSFTSSRRGAQPGAHAAPAVVEGAAVTTVAAGAAAHQAEAGGYGAEAPKPAAKPPAAGY